METCRNIFSSLGTALPACGAAVTIANRAGLPCMGSSRTLRTSSKRRIAGHEWGLAELTTLSSFQPGTSPALPPPSAELVTYVTGGLAEVQRCRQGSSVLARPTASLNLRNKSIRSATPPRSPEQTLPQTKGSVSHRMSCTSPSPSSRAMSGVSLNFVSSTSSAICTGES